MNLRSLSRAKLINNCIITALDEPAKFQALESEEVAEEPISLEEATVLEQNTSGSWIASQEIAGNYASKVATDTDRRAVVQAVINSAGRSDCKHNLIHTNASAQAYADQLYRLEKAVDEMMTTWCRFCGRYKCRRKPAISALNWLPLLRWQVQ